MSARSRSRSRSRSRTRSGARFRGRSRSPRARYTTGAVSTVMAPTTLPTDVQSLMFDYVPEQFEPINCPVLTRNRAECQAPYEYTWGGKKRSCGVYCLVEPYQRFLNLLIYTPVSFGGTGPEDSLISFRTHPDQIPILTVHAAVRECNPPFLSVLGAVTAQFTPLGNVVWQPQRGMRYARDPFIPLVGKLVVFNGVMQDLVQTIIEAGRPEKVQLHIELEIHGRLCTPDSNVLFAMPNRIPTPENAQVYSKSTYVKWISFVSANCDQLLDTMHQTTSPASFQNVRVRGPTLHSFVGSNDFSWSYSIQININC